jgi:hypothetical protein
MDALFTSIVCGLATYALAYIIKYTDGPFKLIVKFRVWIGVAGDDIIGRHTLFNEVLACWRCFTVWVALFWASYAAIFGFIPAALCPVVIFAAWAIAQIIMEYTWRMDN